MHDERIADPVEAVLPQLVFLRYHLVNRVRADMLRDGRMERAVKVRDIRRMRQDLADRAHDAQRGRIMQRRQIAQLLDMMVRLPVDDLAPGIVAAMHDAVAREVDILLLRQLGQAFIPGQVVEDVFEGVFLRGDVLQLSAFDFHVATLVFERCGRGGEAFDYGFGELGGCAVDFGGFVDGDFDAGGAGVDGEDDFHGGGG